jgi:peptidoglycan-associated lipoprotein
MTTCSVGGAALERGVHWRAATEEANMRRLLFVVPLALAVGCAHKAETKKDPVASNTPPPSQPAARAQQKPTLPQCNNDLDCGAAQLCIRGACVDITEGLAECSQVRVHFALNSSELDDEGHNALQRSARCLKADHALHVSIEGNADERGTEEYNLALGDRRATTVEHYLEALGASQNQLRTVSYGKENPLCTEHDEACWAQNRRAELKLATSGERRGKNRRR